MQFSDEQRQIAKIVYQVGLSLKVSDKVMLAAFEAGLVESSMRNLPGGDLDSIGVFQERPSQGWGSPEQIRDPAYSARAFFTHAIAVERNEPNADAGRIAADVERPREEYRGRYGERQAEATELLNLTKQAAGGPPPTPTPTPTPVPKPTPTPLPPTKPVPPAVPTAFAAPAISDPHGTVSGYAQGASGQVVRAWQVAPGGQWIGWLGIGGAPAGRPVVVLDNTGTVSVFVRDKQGGIATSTMGTDGKWGAWADLGGTLAGDPVVLLRQDGALALFAVGTDGQLHTAAQAGHGGHWSGWNALGGELAGVPAVVPGANGAISVFAKGKDDAVHRSTQPGAGAAWSAWASLGASLLGDPVAVAHPDHSVTLFGIGHDGQVYTAAPAATGDTYWTDLGGSFAGTPSAVLTGAGISVFAKDHDDAVSVAHQDSGNWSAWTSLSGSVSGDPVAVARPDGSVTLLGVGYDGQAYITAQAKPDGDWPEWVRLIDAVAS